MPSRVQLQNLVSFVGGLNLRADAFELAEDESPEMLNVDIDPRGGFYSRRGWTRMNENQIDDMGSKWDPRTLFVHELANGTDRIYLANDGEIGYSTNGESWTVLNSTTDIVAAAEPHDADFAPWGDVLYIACGATGSNASVKVTDALVVSRLTQAESTAFSDYDSPTTAFPHCEFVAAHQGYMFAAYTEESGTKHPHRIRWSHPNNPEAWHADDHIDIREGGGPITGLVPMGDHLLIFKQSSVWALFGYESESWQLVNVARELGAIHRQAIARSEHTVFFYSHPNGVYMIQGSEYPREISQQLRPAFQSSDFYSAASANIWMGWVGQRLWFSAPYSREGSVTDANLVVVWDPSLGDGSWVAYQAKERCAVGPFAQGGFGGGAGLRLATPRKYASVVKLDDSEDALDDIDAEAEDPVGFESYYVTRWFDGGYPTIKKRWRRPDVVVKERTQDHTIVVQVHADYDEADVKRTKTLLVAGEADGAVWGQFNWGDDVLYGSGAVGSKIERTSSLGPARSIALRFIGEEGKQWGVDAVVAKYQMRRIR